MHKRTLKIGIMGAAITALCCFTPALVFLLTVVGLTTLGRYLDIVLLPLFGGFLVLIVIALAKKDRGND